jgi:hypothetical protein
MAQAVSCRALTAETRIQSRVSPWHWDRFFPRVLRFSPVNLIPRVLYYSENLKKNTNHLHHRVTQIALRLRCVRSICCGALHQKKSVCDVCRVRRRGIVLLCSEQLPDDRIPVPKHVGVLYLLLNVFDLIV